MPARPKNPKHKSNVTLRGEFYLVVAADQRGGGRVKPISVNSTVPSCKPGQAVIRVALTIDEAALAPILSTPELVVRADDVQKPKLVKVKEQG